jgi:mono/diheme cytochrome c family protein
MNRTYHRLLGLIAAVALLPCTASPTEDASPMDRSIAQGKYLTDVGNCFSCHTQPGAAPFSGGVRFKSPFGVIYSSNITPDRDTGIGSWSAEDLRGAMHEGVAAGGHRLFPAFPYTSFTKATDTDVRAIYAYLRTVKPVRYSPPANGFLFTQRWTLTVWNSLFFEEGRFSPSAAQSAEWNRGAYLVEGLGHCGACHTPRNALMAEAADKALEGGVLEERVAPGKFRRWSAINLTSAKTGLVSWSVDALAKYLQTGYSARAGTFGPMNEVIANGLMKLTPQDARAMAVYLKSLPGREYSGERVSPDQIKAGEPIYKKRCEKCHLASGRGGIFTGPPVAGSAVVQSDDPASLINIILYGAEAAEDVALGGWETMKPYGDVLDDAQVAAVSNYVRGSWGNRARPVGPTEVAQQR